MQREPPRQTLALEEVPLDPTISYTQEQLRQYPIEERVQWAKDRRELLRQTPEGQAALSAERAMAEANIVPSPTQPVLQTIALPAGGGDVTMELARAPPPPVRTVSLPGQRGVVVRSRNATYLTGGERARIGDKKLVIQGYKEGSLCNTLVLDALQRAYAAIELLDPVHASIIRARLAKAGISNANASHVGVRDITFKKAVSIAIQAEKWVYQAQAAAAKSMAKNAKHCLHNLAGKRRRTREEKEDTYMKKYGVARGTRTERAQRKLTKRAENLGGKGE